MAAAFDPYGTEYGDWVDPHTHKLIEQCTGCPTCVGWQGKSVPEIQAARIALVLKRRARDRGEPTAAEIGAEDRAYWSDQYA